MFQNLASFSNRIVRSGLGMGLALAASVSLVQSLSADPLRVSEEDGKRAVVAKVLPVMPPLARQAHLSGKVVVDMTVMEDGKVEKVDVVSGNPILAGAVANATKQWMFTPFQSNGAAAKAIVRATFAFGS